MKLTRVSDDYWMLYGQRLFPTTWPKEFLPVPDAVPVVVKGYEHLDLFAHSEHRISEGRSGCLVCSGVTHNEALSVLHDLLARRGPGFEIAVERSVNQGGLSPRYREEL